MANLTKTMLVGSLLVIGAVAVTKAARVGARLESQALARIYRFDGRGVHVILSITLTNPTNAKLRIKYPYLKVSMNGSKLGENQIRNQDVEIPAHTTVRLSDQLGEDIVVLIPFQNALSVLGPVIGQLIAGAVEEINVQIELSTTAFAAGIPKAVPITVTETIPLKRKTQIA